MYYYQDIKYIIETKLFEVFKYFVTQYTIFILRVHNVKYNLLIYYFFVS